MPGDRPEARRISSNIRPRYRCPAEYQRRIDRAYEHVKAINGMDDVIDPADSADTRSWLVMGLNSIPPTPERTTKKYPYIDTW